MLGGEVETDIAFQKFALRLHTQVLEIPQQHLGSPTGSAPCLPEQFYGHVDLSFCLCKLALNKLVPFRGGISCFISLDFSSLSSS